MRPFSKVEIAITEHTSELETAIIIEIDHDTTNSKPYLVQYAQTKQIKSVSSNQLRIITDVLPPNLLLLPIDNAADTILDTLGSLAQLDTSMTDSLLILQIKRRAISALYPLLNNKALVKIFMQKPYASVIAKLSMLIQHSVSADYALPNDLRCFNRFHLKQYSLSLDRCEQTRDIIEDLIEVPLGNSGWNKIKIYRDPTIVRELSLPYSINDDLKHAGSRKQIRYYINSTIDDSGIRIVSLPANDTLAPLEICGNKYKFFGRVNISDDSGTILYPTFIMENVQLSEGKWYFCVRIPLGSAAQIGWVTSGFTPVPQHSQGVGEDRYSWGYDESR
ncbi:unnamed protein product [Adineta steineri]|uniref:Uncharacterized protein n=1 Tax=Adineta steineri TaxID=433720 RepID=A0A819K082_9BILA|nr:unnamed protein product [Adineta steineri]CAF1358820.1 unnamed protein product [Adineta steineri]CAF1487028.1 unnamed protein product [Adineta steineri]CAF3862258.1 unnamed protein product [Adineta steineri]CAF3936230.1 unnamed protein product [Adineta steineri]